jgi:hypothetical protein
VARLVVFTAVVLMIAGLFSHGRASVALCTAALAGYGIAALLSRRRGFRNASIDGDGNFMDTEDVADHDSLDEGHGSDGGH